MCMHMCMCAGLMMWDAVAAPTSAGDSVVDERGKSEPREEGGRGWKVVGLGGAHGRKL